MQVANLFLLAVIVSAVATDSICGADAIENKPNVILLMADDLGWGDVGYNGHPDLKTPNLDAMAAAGLRFDRFYSAAPVCSPTRGSCLTGRHPYRYGIFFANVGHLPAEELTLAELLNKQGYATGHFGKWHLGTLTKTVAEANRGGPKGAQHFSPPWVNGFAECFSTESKVPTWDPLLRPKLARGNTWWDPVENAANATAYGTNYWTGGEIVSDNLRGDDSRAIMDRAIPFIREQSKAGKPFFAVIWFHAPHLPVVAGAKYTAPYAAFDKHTQHYYGCIAALDEQVGRLRNELRELNAADNTMLWFCSDNGPEGNASSPGSTNGLRGRKRSLFEGGVRVPGIVEWPARVKLGTVTDLPAVTSDYLPTILDVLGVTMPDDRPLDGVSLLPLFDGAMKARPKPIAFESSGQITLVDNRYKIVGSAGGKRNASGKRESQFMLFDLADDQAEQHDISNKHPDLVRNMSAILRQWRASCEKSREGHDYK